MESRRIINFGYDHPIAVDPDGMLLMGTPGLFLNSNQSKNLMANYSVYYNTNLEKIAENLGVESLPAVFENGDDFYAKHSKYALYGIAFYSPGFTTIRRTVRHYINRREKFFYPVQILQTDFFNSDPPLLSPDMREAIDKGLGNVLFLQNTEGYRLGENQLLWVREFSIINNLSEDNFIYSSANLIQEEDYREFLNANNYEGFVKFIPDYHFENSPWFTPGHFHYVDDYNRKILEGRLQHNRSVKFDKHFLCFNRRPHYHRILLYLYMKINEDIDKVSVKSLGRETNLDIWTHYKNSLDKNTYIYLQYEELKEALENHNYLEDVRVDIDSSANQANYINYKEHNRCFINLVTETSIDPKALFFSEKIFKPIHLCQPFILLGNPFSLKKLKEMGYQTFDKWWDESYDEEVNMYIRIQKIVELLKEISTWPKEKLNTTIIEMEPVLKNNFNIFISKDRFENQLSYLECKKRGGYLL